MTIEWKDNPTTTTVNTTAYPIENVEFPAITICSQGAAKDILDTAMLKQFEKYLKSKGKIIPNSKLDGKTKSKERRKRSLQEVVDYFSKEEVNKIGFTLITYTQYLFINIMAIRLKFRILILITFLVSEMSKRVSK